MEILIYILKIKIDLFVVEIRLNELKYFFYFSNDIKGLVFLFQGLLIVIIQELDGLFNYNFKIEENKIKFDIICYFKCRRYFLFKYFYCVVCI